MKEMIDMNRRCFGQSVFACGLSSRHTIGRLEIKGRLESEERDREALDTLQPTFVCIRSCFAKAMESSAPAIFGNR